MIASDNTKRNFSRLQILTKLSELLFIPVWLIRVKGVARNDITGHSNEIRLLFENDFINHINGQLIRFFTLTEMSISQLHYSELAIWVKSNFHSTIFLVMHSGSATKQSGC